MALYDINSLKSLYTKIGNKFNTCYLCEKIIRQQYSNKEITLDEMFNKIKALTGQLNSKKVAYIDYAGTTLYICKNCLNKIYNELNLNCNTNTNINTDIKESTKKNTEESYEGSKLEINLKKGKKNVTK